MTGLYYKSRQVTENDKYGNNNSKPSNYNIYKYRIFDKDIDSLSKKLELVKNVYHTITSCKPFYSEFAHQFYYMNNYLRLLIHYLNLAKKDNDLFVINIKLKCKTPNYLVNKILMCINDGYESYYKLIEYIVMPIQYPSIYKLRNIDTYIREIDSLLFSAYPNMIIYNIKKMRILITYNLSKKNV